MAQEKLGEAAATLERYLTEKPDSLGGWNLVRTVHWRRNDIPACREATRRLCVLNAQAGLYEAAWQDYEEFINLGGDKMPPGTWLELCRVPEERNDYKRALSEYEKLAAAHPSERQGLTAQLGAARILLKR
jgi:tetratricopeptide (TPR) repeat protein